MASKHRVVLEFKVNPKTFRKWSVKGLHDNLGLTGNMVPKWMLHDLVVVQRPASYVIQQGIPWLTRVAFLCWFWYRRLRPIVPVLVYSSTECKCGARMAYDERGVSGQPMTGYWECSRLLLGERDVEGHAWRDEHTDRLPFSIYELKVDDDYEPAR